MIANARIDVGVFNEAFGWALKAAAALERVRRKLNDGGDRQILTSVLMMGCRPLRPLAQKRIRCRHRHRDVILNILARQQPQAASAPIATPACLPVKITPLADCAQYDSLSCMPLASEVRAGHLRRQGRDACARSGATSEHCYEAAGRSVF